MGRNRLLQSLEIITTLEYRDNSASCAAIGEVDQLARHPCEVFSFEIERRQWVPVMSIESCRDDDELRAEFAQIGQDGIFEGRAELGAAILGGERRVDDIIVIAAFPAGAGSGKQWHL